MDMNDATNTAALPHFPARAIVANAKLFGTPITAFYNMPRPARTLSLAEVRAMGLSGRALREMNYCDVVLVCWFNKAGTQKVWVRTQDALEAIRAVAAMPSTKTVIAGDVKICVEHGLPLWNETVIAA